MNPAGPQYLVLLVLATGVVLLAWIAVRASRRRSVSRIAGVLVGLVAVYSAGLLGTSLLVVAPVLRPGDTKCFDEWCATMLGAQTGPARDQVTVHVRLANQGRRPQKSVLARAFIESRGKRSWPLNPDVLQTPVPGGGSFDIRLLFALSPYAPSPHFVVTEAASGSVSPGIVIIDDESSPFHSLAGWPVSLSDAATAGPTFRLSEGLLETPGLRATRAKKGRLRCRQPDSSHWRAANLWDCWLTGSYFSDCLAFSL